MVIFDVVSNKKKVKKQVPVFVIDYLYRFAKVK